MSAPRVAAEHFYGATARPPGAVAPEPRGPRAVALALARLGLITGSRAHPHVLTGPVDPALVHAIRGLIDAAALVWDEPRDAFTLTEYGAALYGPDLRQRPFLTPR